MGLDMFLERRVRVGANYAHNKVTGNVSLQKEGIEIPVNAGKIKEIVEDAGYWRKANHIHQWFVVNVQDGKDDCGEYWVSKENLEKLLADCKAVKTNPSAAAATMPTKDGFFFGGVEYDEYYFKDIDETIEIVENALRDIRDNGRLIGEYYYQSSW